MDHNQSEAQRLYDERKNAKAAFENLHDRLLESEVPPIKDTKDLMRHADKVKRIVSRLREAQTLRDEFEAADTAWDGFWKPVKEASKKALTFDGEEYLPPETFVHYVDGVAVTVSPRRFNLRTWCRDPAPEKVITDLPAPEQIFDSGIEAPTTPK